MERERERERERLNQNSERRDAPDKSGEGRVHVGATTSGVADQEEQAGYQLSGSLISDTREGTVL